MDRNIIVVKRTSTRKQIREALQKLKQNKTFNANKHLGALKGVFGEAMEFQNQARDEWS
jgi:hypothetical protein